MAGRHTQEDSCPSPEPMLDIGIGSVCCQRGGSCSFRWSKYSALVHQNKRPFKHQTSFSPWYVKLTLGNKDTSKPT